LISIFHAKGLYFSKVVERKICSFIFLRLIYYTILLYRLLREKSKSLVSEVDQCLEKLEHVEDNAAFNFVNALVDLLWAFELRATASWVFQLAIKRSIYRHDVFR
jgi:hypothetical protein